MAFGTFNNPDSGARFMIGIGGSEASRTNAFEVYSDGRVKVYRTPTEDNDVVRKLELNNIQTNLLEQINQKPDADEVTTQINNHVETYAIKKDDVVLENNVLSIDNDANPSATVWSNTPIDTPLEDLIVESPTTYKIHIYTNSET
jgi:hypothetical protein